MMRYFCSALLLVVSPYLLASDSVLKSWHQLLTEEQRNLEVSLNIPSTPLADIFKILADQLSLNLIVSDQVKGHSSLTLNKVRWIDAVESLTASNQLHIRLKGNVMWVSTVAPKSAKLAPVYPTLIPINFAKADDIAELLRTSEQSFLSPNAAISVDQRTNTLIVNESPERMTQIQRLIAELDVPVRQVMIEARMVSLKTNLAEEFGVRWGAAENGLAVVEDATFVKGMQVSLPTIQPAATVGLNVARLSDDLLLDLELTALERENKGEIIASPKIFTANQQPAYIEQGTEIPYVESAASGATAVQFKKAVMGLRVTPQITPNDHVLLDLTITQNTRGDTVSTPTGPAVAIDTQEMATRVLVKDGETIVLGGIFQSVELKDNTRVPILSSVPLLGNLFQQRQQRTEKRELLIFVTPRLLASAE